MLSLGAGLASFLDIVAVASTNVVVARPAGPAPVLGVIVP